MRAEWTIIEHETFICTAIHIREKRRAISEGDDYSSMKQATKQIAICALALLVFCAVCRWTLFRTYTIHVPVDAALTRESSQPPSIEVQDGVHIDGETWRNGVLHVSIRPDRPGEADVIIRDANSDMSQYHPLRISRLGTVYDLQTGGFSGDEAVLIAVTLFWLLVSAIMFWHYLQAKGQAFYAYSTIYFAGFSIFTLVTGLLMLRVTVLHLVHPANFNMYAAYSTINGASKQFMLMTMPITALFALAMAVSNVELLRHQKPQLQNVLGLLVSLLLILGEIIGLALFIRDFSGSEWEGRIQNTLENVYVTVFVYFECMLLGSVICGMKAARHQPAMDKDFIIILGCWFRKDGTLPPLLRGRVDRALEFWHRQKVASGKEAIFIPSGGQGADETMPEAEAMRRYLVSQGIPERMILPETQSANTYQNMAFSKKIVDAIDADGKVIFATTNYHVFRSGLWASRVGLAAEGIGGKTRWWYWPNAFMRECAGLMKSRWKQEILLLILLILFFGVLTMVVG